MILTFDDVGKSYGEIRALDALSFRVDRDEIVALLGPNGAGKTTALEIALGLRDADSGSVRLFGAIASQHRGSPAARRDAARERLSRHAARRRDRRVRCRALPATGCGSRDARARSVWRAWRSAAPERSREENRAAWRWHSRSSAIRSSSCSTSRRPASTSNRAAAFGTSCARSARAARFSSRPTTWRRHRRWRRGFW